MNKGYMNKIYFYICYKYLNGKPERKIENLEKILFLIQYQSLTSNHTPFLKEKIYIYNDEIRVKYLSDLLRVSPVIAFGGEGMYLRKVMINYQKKLQNFSKLSDEKLNEKVSGIIQKGNLDEKYFVYEKYKDIHMRKIARVTTNEQKYHLTGSIEYGILAGISLRKAVGICLILSFLIPAIICLPLLITTRNFFYLSYFIVFLSIACIFIGVYLFWNHLWSKPTEYEIKNEYVSE